MSFTVSPLSQSIIDSMVKAKVWTPECPFSFSRLTLLELSHYNFDGKVTKGQMVVFDVVADEVITIFQKLYESKFPIAKICLIDAYNGNDEASMEDNNSSCFNFRCIAGTTTISLHGLGMAIDINPIQNPYLILNEKKEIAQLFPKLGNNYLDRYDKRPGMVEDIADIFKAHGFKAWGGEWHDCIDYHHFQVERTIAEKLVTMNFDEGIKLFRSQVKIS